MANYQQLIELSERKHSPDKHYKIVIGKDKLEYDTSAINYIYDNIKFAKNIPQKEFNFNRLITKTPGSYHASLQEEEFKGNDNWEKWLRGRYLNAPHISDRAIAYLTLKELGVQVKLTEDVNKEIERVQYGKKKVGYRQETNH